MECALFEATARSNIRDSLQVCRYAYDTEWGECKVSSNVEAARY